MESPPQPHVVLCVSTLLLCLSLIEFFYFAANHLQNKLEQNTSIWLNMLFRALLAIVSSRHEGNKHTQTQINSYLKVNIFLVGGTSRLPRSYFVCTSDLLGWFSCRKFSPFHFKWFI